jgi:hypothetical protein
LDKRFVRKLKEEAGRRGAAGAIETPNDVTRQSKDQWVCIIIMTTSFSFSRFRPLLFDGAAIEDPPSINQQGTIELKIF